MRKMLILIAVALPVLVWWLMWSKNGQIPESVQGNDNSVQTASEVKLNGLIQVVDNQQPTDGNLRVKINDMWVIIGGGEMPISNQGKVIGFDFNNLESNVGKRAEVYGKKIVYSQSLTILESNKYYLKIIQ